MTCPRCGSAADDNLRTCPVCRAPLGPAPDAAATDIGLAAAFEVDITQVPADVDGATRVAAMAVSDDETNLGSGPVPAAPSPRPIKVRPPAAPGSTYAAGDLVGYQLGPRYHIIKLLGAGGMGAVYQAWDDELGVAVALKTVRPEVADEPGDRPRCSSGGSSRSCCWRARSRTRTSSACTTSARSTASSTSRCRMSKARTWPRSSKRNGKLDVPRGA